MALFCVFFHLVNLVVCFIWMFFLEVAAQNTKPWHCNIQRLDDDLEPASSVAWSMVRVPLPVVNSTRASRPGLAARAARSALHVALEARWAAIDAQLQQAEEMREIPDSLSQPRNENLDSLEEIFGCGLVVFEGMEI